MKVNKIWEKLFKDYVPKNEPKKKYKSQVTLKNLTKVKNITRINKIKEVDE